MIEEPKTVVCKRCDRIVIEQKPSKKKKEKAKKDKKQKDKKKKK